MIEKLKAASASPLICIRCFGESDGEKTSPAVTIFRGHAICRTCLLYLVRWEKEHYPTPWDYTLAHSHPRRSAS